MEQVKVNDEVLVVLHSPIGDIEEVGIVLTELREMASCSYTRYIVNVNNKACDITLAMFAANDDLKFQNWASREMEQEYGKEQGRYWVRDMILHCIHFYPNKPARLEFYWTDCYGTTRVYLGHDCETELVNGKIRLQPTRPQFYF